MLKGNSLMIAILLIFSWSMEGTSVVGLTTKVGLETTKAAGDAREIAGTGQFLTSY
jgi:hypothetical protein